MLDVRPLTELDNYGKGGRIRKSQLTGLIRPRVEETLEYVADGLRGAGFLGRDVGTVVFTGGGSQLPGINHLGEHILGAPVRFGYPQLIRGLPEAMSGPAFSAISGALLQAAGVEDKQDFSGRSVETGREGRWPRRIVQWLREAI